MTTPAADKPAPRGVTRLARNPARGGDEARLTIRIDFGGHGALGPGKVRLPELIGAQGSISAAGRAMGMSYRRAWLLIDSLNQAFREPVVATQHGGQETTLFSIITNLLHLGLTIVGLDYGFAGQIGVDKVRGGSPYGATTVAGADGSRLPSEEELDGARYQGRRIAEVAAKLLLGATSVTKGAAHV